ncbi:SGNH/GDSL hydrolase family protein, partial [Candidatus Dependentiae bacterium]|nr:SGNH/GDSL hydrolase family protein [Candidatus Dependentiae bacterium]
MKFFILAIILLIITISSFYKTKRLKKFFGLLTILVFLLTLLEIVFRLAEPFLSNNSLWISDKQLGFKVRPYFNHTNNLGFNDINRTLEKSGILKRIIGLGDSFNWAGGYEGNYWTLTEKILNQDTKTYEIINMGYPSIGPGYLYNLLLSTGLKYNPDIVFLAFFIGNDFGESHFDTNVTVRFGEPFYKSNRHFFKITNESYFFQYLDMKKKIIRNNILKKTDKSKESATFSNYNFLKIEKD